MASARASLGEVHRIVVKIGSRSLMADPERFTQLAGQVRVARDAGRRVVLVSSGAVALGRKRLGLEQRPKAIDLLQAAAATGQSLLMRAYEDAFEARGLHVAQVLLTHLDLADRERYLNARRAIDALLELGVVPIINENDTVAVEEIKFGDNDQLAAMVSTLVGADLLVLLTDVEGLLDAGGTRVPVVEDLAHAAELVRPPTDDVGLGGMASKIRSAREATHHGVPVLIGDAGDPDLLARIVAGEDVGTLFLPQGTRLASRKHWIAYTLKPQGTIVIDDGAARAIGGGKSSLLPAGVIGVRGDFEPGQSVRIEGRDGREVARGLARYGAAEVCRLAGASSKESQARLGRHAGDAIVHVDDLVIPT